MVAICIRGFPKSGVPFEVPVITIIVFWVYFRVPLVKATTIGG